MRAEEAIDMIQNDIKLHHDYLSGTYRKALNMAIEALEKQILKSPILEGDGYADGEMVYDRWYCPRCDMDYDAEYEKHDYCPVCGQKILWKED